MKILIIHFVIILFTISSGDKRLMIIDEQVLDFSIKSNSVEDPSIKMFCALIDKEMEVAETSYKCDVDFQEHMLPLDIYDYYSKRQEESYYTLLTKTVYGFDQEVSFFSPERLSSVEYLKKIMPANKVSKKQENYFLEVGFGAPDIVYSLDFYNNDELSETYPELVSYFKKHDNMDLEPSLTVFQHNHTFGKVLGQKTSKMSVSITRYFDAGSSQTLVVNYTLNYIHNLPPVLIGGGKFLINQMKEGVLALIRDTSKVCEEQEHDSDI